MSELVKIVQWQVEGWWAGYVGDTYHSYQHSRYYSFSRYYYHPHYHYYYYYYYNHHHYYPHLDLHYHHWKVGNMHSICDRCCW